MKRIIIEFCACAMVALCSYCITQYYAKKAATAEAERQAAEIDLATANTQLEATAARIAALEAAMRTMAQEVEYATDEKSARDADLGHIPPVWGDCILPACVRDAFGTDHADGTTTGRTADAVQ